MKKRHGAAIIIVAMLVALGASIVLVLNRQSAVTQAREIVAKDNAGGNVQTDMLKLKTYADRHMKVNMQYILVGSYDRAVVAAKEAAMRSNTAYSAAQANCDKRGVDSIRQANCVAAYLATHGSATVEPKLPSKDQYTIKVVGPSWTFDDAGLLFVLSGLLLAAGAFSMIRAAVTK